MTKSAVGNAVILSLAMLIAGSGTMGCSRSDGGSAEQRPLGGVGLTLVVSQGVTVKTLTYTISGNGFSKTGSIDVEGTGNTFNTTISGIPAATGYTIQLDGTASNGSKGTGSATFDVVARQIRTVAVVLRFTAPTPTTGSILVDGTTNVCPVAESIVAQPAKLAVGASAQIVATGSDEDKAPSALTYAWTLAPAGIGTLSSTSTANPTFTATAAGTVTLTLTVSDGDTVCATLTGSLNSLDLPLIVTGGSGAGGAGTGVSGAGAGGAGAGGAGAGGAGAGGAGAGGAGAGGAGAGGAGAGGAGAGGAGAGGAGAGGAGAGGAGAGGAGAGGAGAGGAGAGGAGTGGAGSGGNAACLQCESVPHEGLTSCPDGRAAGLALAGNTPVLPNIPESTGQPRAVVFQAILDCFHANHCAKVADTDCFCGAGVEPNVCFSQGTFETATGPCKNLAAIGAESTAIGDINSRFFDPTFALGAAAAVIETCDQFSCVNECL